MKRLSDGRTIILPPRPLRWIGPSTKLKQTVARLGDSREEFTNIMTRTHLSNDIGSRRIIPLIALLLAAAATSAVYGEDWGALCALIPASAPGFVLEAVGSGMTDGTVISIARPVGSPNQKWVIAANGNNRYSIKPSYSSTLVLAAARGGTGIGTAIVLETESGKPWQEWNLKKNENGSYCLVPRHAPEKGLDHLGGRAVAGAKIDLWANHPGDQHLEWIVKPLAGTMAAVAPWHRRVSAQHVRSARN